MQPREDLPRRLGFTDAVSIVVGVIIGAGIFLVPSLVAKSLPSRGWIFAAWSFGGVLSFFGALAMAELGAMMPATGGQYVFLREAYGPMLAFLCGWTSFLTSQSAAIAWLAVSFSLYLGYFTSLTPWVAKAIGVALIGVVAGANYRGVKLGAGVQKLFTAAKLIGLAVLVGSAFFVSGPPPAATPEVKLTLSAFGVALIATLLSYDGWAALSSVSGEIRDPAKNVLRALAAGVLICIVVYNSANFAYLRAFSPAEMAASNRIGAALGERSLGHFGGTIVTLTILVSIIGGVNGWLMTLPRIMFAQARDGLFFQRFGEVHEEYRTPGFSIAMTFVWSAVLVASGSYEILITYAMFSLWLFYALTVGAVILLRRQQPLRERPYRMWGYPLTPAAFIIVAVWFLVNTTVEQPGPSLAALAIILAGVPVYLVWRRFWTAPAATGSPARQARGTPD